MCVPIFAPVRREADQKCGRFWFAGALGMLLESRKLRFWISQSALEASAAKEQTELTQLPSWSSGFNPFPGALPPPLVVQPSSPSCSIRHRRRRHRNVSAPANVPLSDRHPRALGNSPRPLRHLPPPHLLLPLSPPSHLRSPLATTDRSARCDVRDGWRSGLYSVYGADDVRGHATWIR